MTAPAPRAEQGTLFGNLYSEPLTPAAKARASDPASSHAAAERMNATGLAKAHAERITDLVFRAPGSTAYELAAMTESDPDPLNQVQILRRLSSIPDVRQGTNKEARKCRVSQRVSTTWWPRG